MILDAQNLLWDAAALTADAASTNALDLGVAGTDPGRGEPLALVITVDVAADHTTGDETYQFQIIESAAANLSSPNIIVSRDILYSDLTAGSIHVIPVPPGRISLRYLGAYFNGGGTSPTITVTAFLTRLNMVQLDAAYADALTID